MWNLADRLPSPPTLLRIGLVVFVLAWLFAPYWLQSAIPIWLPFLIALGLEVHFFVGALREPPMERPDRGPQSTDRERYGYGDDAEELLLGHGDGACVLVVGHEPDFSQLVHDFTGGRVDVKKGGVAAVRISGSQAEQTVLLRPAELQAIAGS